MVRTLTAERALLLTAACLLLLLLVGCGATEVPAVTVPAGPTKAAVSTVVATDTAVSTATVAPTDTAVPTDTVAPTSTVAPTATPVPTLLPVTATPLPAAEPAAGLDPELLAQMDAIEAEMEALRGLEATAPITRSLMTREELADYFARQLEEEYPPEEVAADVRVLAAFDFLPADYDLEGLLLDLYSSQVLGLYDDEADTFYVVSAGEFELLDRMTFAHEFVHGLQDEHFALETFVDEEAMDDDALLARMSLVEGDASLAMTEYLIAHLSELTAADVEALQSEEAGGDQAVLEAAPPIIRETFVFPYVYGLDFVTALQEAGWDAVDAAFADPPQSTEQILHPEKYFQRDEPVIVALSPLTDTLGAGWHLVDANNLGEFQTALYLEQRVDPAMADLAAAGWDGDRYALYARDGDDLLVWGTAWDTAQDRDEFVFAYRQYAGDKYGGPATRSEENALWWETPAQTAVVTWAGERVWIVLGPDVGTVEGVLAALG